jgi:hypothetical protein
MAGAIDLFVPTCTQDLDQATILFQSMSRFVAPDVWASVSIGAVDLDKSFDDIRELRTGRFQEQTSYMGLADLGIPEPHLDGWVIQQAAKLAFARHAQTEFYAVLDSKNIARAPIELSDLVKDGQAAGNFEYASAHPSFWRDAAWALDHRGFDRSRRRLVLSVFTPVLLHTATVRQLVDFIESKFDLSIGDFFRAQCNMIGSKFDKVMVRAGRRRAVAEFPLYFVYLDKVDRLDRHFSSPILQQQPYGWWPQNPEERSALCKRILSDDQDGLFAGVHRTAWTLMNEADRHALREFTTFGLEYS